MRRTPLHSFHIQRRARMVEFAGWEMPLLYSSIVEEHQQTRREASIFDVSHMGRIELWGDGVEGLLQRVCTRQLGDAVPGQCRYSHVCNEQGGILDDVIVSRYQDHWLVVCNASNRERIVSWLEQHNQEDARIADQTEATLMVAVQGPAAVATLEEMLPIPVGGLRRYHFVSGVYLLTPYTAARTGYTGEDGIELILPAAVGAQVGEFLDQGREEASEGEGCGRDKTPQDRSTAGSGQGLKPAGLGARDTLRIEAGLPLYGHELHQGVDTISAGLGWCVDLGKDFIGAEALRQVAEEGPRRRLVGLELEGRRIAREHAVVRSGEQIVGEVTSGTLAPSLQRSIAMGYVRSKWAEPGQGLTVDVGGGRVAAAVVRLPFYKRGGG